MKKILNGLDLTGQKIANLADPSSPTDAVTRQFLEAFVRGLSHKQPVRAASTTNVSLSAPGATLDGIALNTGDRVLLKDQGTGSQNGIYVWTGASANLTRSSDADVSSELESAAVLVTAGTVNAAKQFVQATAPVTLGTTTLNFVETGGSSAPYTAGPGLQLQGQSFSVKIGAGLIVDGDSLRIDPSVVTRKYAANVPSGATSATLTHNLATTDVVVQTRVASTGEVVEPDVTITSANTVVLTFATAPTAGQYRCVVQG